MRRIWLTQKRLEAGLKQYELAERVDISKSEMSGIECGVKTPSGKVAAKLARELEFDMILFFPEESGVAQ